MTETEAKRRGFNQPVMLSLWNGRWYYRELDDKQPDKPETPALRDRLGACVYRHPADGLYFDLPQRAERLLLD